MKRFEWNNDRNISMNISPTNVECMSQFVSLSKGIKNNFEKFIRSTHYRECFTSVYAATSY